MTLQVAGFLEHSTVNGTGFRSVLFVSGCQHNCPGCQNEAMQDSHYGESLSIHEVFTRILKNKPIIDGVTFSGGEPFDQADSLEALAKLLKAEDLSIWCYSGYTYDVLAKDPKFSGLLSYIDVLVDGPYVESLYDPNLKFRGSSNQKIYAISKGQIQKELDFE